MFTLLPGHGVELPHRAGTLEFGMSERQAQWAVSTLADVRAGWVCGAGWAFYADYGDLTIHVWGDDLRRSRPGVAEIRFTRLGDHPPTTPGTVPVAYDDIDLFGYPVPEVEEALPEGLGLTLERPPPGPRSRHSVDRPTRQYLVSVALSHPGR